MDVLKGETANFGMKGKHLVWMYNHGPPFDPAGIVASCLRIDDVGGADGFNPPGKGLCCNLLNPKNCPYFSVVGMAAEIGEHIALLNDFTKFFTVIRVEPGLLARQRMVAQ